MGEGGRFGPRLSRRLAAATVLVAAAGAAAAVLLLGSGPRPAPAAGGGLGPGRTTSLVARRTLTESATVEGTLGYGAKLDLYNRLAGTFTWLPAIGAVIRRGGTLWRIDNRPVALMYGPVPAYRTLRPGVGGPDVAELNRNLIDLGFDPYGAIEDEASFGAATAAAVRRWQESEHLPVTGEVELGRIAFAPGARRVTSLQVMVGQDPPPSQPAKQAPKEEPAARKPTSETAAAEAALATTSARQIVQLGLNAAEQGLARVGKPAPVTLPGGSVVKGRIAAVGRVAEAAEGGGGPEGGGEPTIPVTVALDHPVARLDEAPVSVSLVERVRRHVLAVPATALFATGGDRYAIEALEHGRRRRLAVRPGMFAGGYVQIEGRGVRPGLRVVEPSE